MIKNKNRSIIIVIYLFFLVSIYIPIERTATNEEWHESETYDILGLVFYLNPKPGVIKADYTKINGTIKFNGSFTGYETVINVSLYWLETDQGEEIARHEYPDYLIRINSSTAPFLEEISIDIPKEDQFIVFIVLILYWMDMDFEPHGEYVLIRGSYNKTESGFDLIYILFPGGFLIFLILLIFTTNRIRNMRYDPEELNQEIEDISHTLSQYFMKGGGLKEIKLDKESSTYPLGYLNRLMREKKELDKEYLKLTPKISEMEEITDKIDKLREPILQNSLFKFISSIFIRASRKREFYTPDDEALVQRLRNSLKEGSWEELQEKNRVLLAWKISQDYIGSSKEDGEFLIQVKFDNIEDEASKLADLVKDYIRLSNTFRWPPDRPLILQRYKDIEARIQLLDIEINKTKKMNKKDLKDYKKQCIHLKKELETNLRWVRSKKELLEEENFIDLTMKLNQLILFLKEELEILAKSK